LHNNTEAGPLTTQALFAPALISLIIFLILTYVIVPCWTRYRNRYAQYLPLDTLQNQTLSLRGRLHGAFSRLMAWSIWRARRNADRVVVADRGSFDSEAGEELGAVDEETARRMRNQHGGRSGVDSTRRLSRESVL